MSPRKLHTTALSPRESEKTIPLLGTGSRDSDDTTDRLGTMLSDDYVIKDTEVRNLKLHAGRLTEEKDTAIQNTFDEGVDEIEVDIYGQSSFHLKFGFSNSQSSLANLVRVAPYTERFVDYNGKLDHPNRMVSNYQGMWGRVRSLAQ